MKFAGAKTSCEQASVFYYDYINGDLDNAEPSIFSHIKECAFCSSEIERLKELLVETTDQTANGTVSRKNKLITTILASHFHLADKEVTCGIAKQFMSSLASPLTDIRVATPITAHIENCPLCRHDLDVICGLKLTDEQLTRLGRVITIQTLGHNQDISSEEIDLLKTIGVDNNTLNVLKQILERQESGIVTEYITRKETSISGRNAPTKHNNNVRIHNNSQAGGYNRVRKLVKPLATIAALIFAATWLFVGTFANAIEYDDIYNAISRMQNICLMTGEFTTNEPTQKVWISNTLNVKLFHSGNHWMLWDIQNKIKKTQITGSDSSEVGNLNDADIASIKQTMNIPLGVLPFQRYSSLPNKYSWKLSADDKVALQIRNTCIYDLLWVDKTANDSSIHYKWRAYIDKDTMLPKRVENWRKQSAASQYELTGWTNITYPTTQEVKYLIGSIAFTGK
ncbi:MAG: hypothetical protein WC770_05445 [Phycisphaerae bacterium]|jgi:hypothetical protein